MDNNQGIFSQLYEITAHDTDPNNNIRPSAALRILQDAAYRQMQEKKPTYMDLFLENKAFIITRITFRQYERLGQFENIKVQTWPCEGKGVSFVRAYRILKEDKTVAEAMSIWALVNPKDKTFWTQDSVDLSNYYYDQPISLPDLRLRIPNVEMQEVAQKTVQYSEIDCNQHMNNTNYPDILFNCIPGIQNKYVTGFSIHFSSDAHWHETIQIHRSTPVSQGEETSYYFKTIHQDKINIMAKMTVKDLT